VSDYENAREFSELSDYVIHYDTSVDETAGRFDVSYYISHLLVSYLVTDMLPYQTLCVFVCAYTCIWCFVGTVYVCI